MAFPKTPMRDGPRHTSENLKYIRQMLGELRSIADAEGCNMLCYLLEMAYLEAGDLQAGDRNLSSRKSQ